MTDKEIISNLESTVDSLREEIKDQQRGWEQVSQELTCAEKEYEDLEERYNELEEQTEETNPLVQTLADHLLSLGLFSIPCNCGRCHVCEILLALRELLKDSQSVCQLDRATTDLGGSVYV